MRSKQYFTSIKNNPHEISTDPNKYLSPVAVKKYKAEKNKLTVSLKENAPFVIYSDKPLLKCQYASYKKLDNGFYLVTPDSGKNQFVIYK